MHLLENFPKKRTVLLRMSGVISSNEMRSIVAGIDDVCSTYRGAKLAMIADMRDLAPLAPDAAELLREGIAIGRRHGVVLCAHLSNTVIIRLQANRVSREANAGDACVVDVVSLEEAWKLIAERSPELFTSDVA